MSALANNNNHDFQSVNVKLFGRYMLEDFSEYPCQVVDMSPGNAQLIAERSGQIGERIIAYIDHIGRVEGVLTLSDSNGFGMTIQASDRKRDKLAAQLTWLANRHELGLPEDRRHERMTPSNPVTILSLNDGRQYECRIVDLSLSGSAVEIDVRPAIGTQVTLGTMRGEVVRHFEDGIAIEFAVVQKSETLQSLLSKSA
jgi:PilZ domain